MEKNIYIENGYRDRKDYLKSLSLEYGISLYTVEIFANLLGEGEDFDGLILMIEDFSNQEEY